MELKAHFYLDWLASELPGTILFPIPCLPYTCFLGL